MKRITVVVVLLASIADAHDLRPGILAFVEDEPGELRMRFVPPIDSRGEAIELALVLPDGCTRVLPPVRETGPVPISAARKTSSVPIPAHAQPSVPIPAQPSVPIPAPPPPRDTSAAPVPTRETGPVPIAARETSSVPIAPQRSLRETSSVPISAQRISAQRSVPVSARPPSVQQTGAVPSSAQPSPRETDSVLISAQPSAPAGDRVHCKRGFGGVLAVGGMRGHAMKIYVSHERDGVRRDWVITSDSPRLDLGAAPSVLARIGVAAIALLVGLLLVFGPSLRLAAAVAAFVAAETIAGFLGHVDSLVVVATASILFVAREATHDDETAIRRWPWLVGVLLGAVHGLAFASHPRYLLAHVGAIGALSVGVGIANWLVRERLIIRLGAHRAACYALGTLAAWWLLAQLARS